MENDDILNHGYTTAQVDIRTAFLELLRKKAYAAIKIKDVAEKSGYSRQTVYFYYKSKEQILSEIIEDLADGITGLMEQASAEGIDKIIERLTESYHPFYIEYFCYMRRYSDIFLILLRTGNGVNFLQRFNAIVKKYQETKSMKRLVQFNGNGNNEKMLLMYQTSMRNLINASFEWVQNGMEPDEITMAKYHSWIWVCGVLLLKDEAKDSICARLVQKMHEKDLNILEQI